MVFLFFCIVLFVLSSAGGQKRTHDNAAVDDCNDVDDDDDGDGPVRHTGIKKEIPHINSHLFISILLPTM